jgi:hypothetical protein
MTQNVMAQVVLRSPGGASILDAAEALTPETLERYRPAPAAVEAARRALEEAGFTVHGAGEPSTLSIEGPRERFEAVFQTRLEPRAAQPPQPAGAGYYAATGPIRVPEPLSEVVAAVTLPEPPLLFR